MANGRTEAEWLLVSGSSKMQRIFEAAKAAARSRPVRRAAGRISAIRLLPRVTTTVSPASTASSRSEKPRDASVALIVLM